MFYLHITFFAQKDPSKNLTNETSKRNRTNSKSDLPLWWWPGWRRHARSCQDEQSKQRKHWDNMGAVVFRFSVIICFPSAVGAMFVKSWFVFLASTTAWEHNNPETFVSCPGIKLSFGSFLKKRLLYGCLMDGWNNLSARWIVMWTTIERRR